MLFISNPDVERLLSMKEAIKVQEEAFKGLETGASIHRPRIDMYAPSKTVADGYYRWGTMEGWYDGIFAIRMKSDLITWPRHGNGSITEEKYSVQPGTFCGLIMLFSSDNAEPLAMINDGVLQHMRVGAGAGIGAKLLARKNASTVGMLGSGGMAETFLAAYCEVRPIKKVKVFSPTKANRESFAKRMSERHNIEVAPVDSAREAVKGVDILSTNTDSMVPTFEADWIEPGMHVGMLGPCEISPAAEKRFDVSIRQGVGGLKMPETDRIKMEIGMSPLAYIGGTKEEMKRLPEKTPGSGFGGNWPDFCDLTFGRAKGRTKDEQVTFYHNMGNQGLQFAAVGGLVYRKAKAEQGIRSVPTEWFVQDIRD
ncbi:MAG TPA: ornithine cyclodeaminase family protein [Alphaproteobacteria bacterium]|nr:ornithine cyclodeaminase family protein [Alphaproteobacteria bacterium]